MISGHPCADAAVEQTPTIEKVVVLPRTGRTPGREEGAHVDMKKGRDVWWDDWLAATPSAAAQRRASSPEAFQL